MALFTVRPETRPHDRARPTALGAARERGNPNREAGDLTRARCRPTTMPPGIPSCTAPPGAPVTGVQPVPGLKALRAATRAMRSSRPGATHGPTNAALPRRGGGCVTPALWGVTQSAAQATTRPFTAFRR